MQTLTDPAERARVARRMALSRRSFTGKRWRNKTDAEEYQRLVWETIRARFLASSHK